MDNAIVILDVAHRVNATKLREAAINFVADNTEELMEHPDWARVISGNAALVEEILRRNL
jgi:hypothetical protein